MAAVMTKSFFKQEYVPIIMALVILGLANDCPAEASQSLNQGYDIPAKNSQRHRRGGYDVTSEAPQRLTHEHDVSAETSQSLDQEHDVSAEASQSLDQEHDVSAEASQSRDQEHDVSAEASQSLDQEHDVPAEASQSRDQEHDVSTEASQSLDQEHDVSAEASQSLDQEHDVSTEASQSLDQEHEVSTEASQSLNQGYDLPAEASQSLPVDIYLGYDIPHSSADNTFLDKSWSPCLCKTRCFVRPSCMSATVYKHENGTSSCVLNSEPVYRSHLIENPDAITVFIPGTTICSGEGFEMVNGVGCTRMIKKNKSWHGAKEYCNSLDSELYTAVSQQQLDLLWDAIVRWTPGIAETRLAMWLYMKDGVWLSNPNIPVTGRWDSEECGVIAYKRQLKAYECKRHRWFVCQKSF